MAADQYFLSKGEHNTADEGRCAMEWVAFIAGEDHTDHPRCVSPVLQRFCINFNDRLGDQDRQRMRPYLARCIGTAADGLDDQRQKILREWLIRTAAPDWLDLAGKTDMAKRLRDLPGPLVEHNVVRLLQDVRSGAFAARDEARAKLRQQLTERLGPKHAASAAYVSAVDASAHAADAAADAAASASADATAYAYADATASASADAAATAHAAAAATAYAYADASASAHAAAYASAYVSAADAAAYAYAAATASPSATYESVYNAVYSRVKTTVAEKLAPIRDRHNEQGFELLERMLPKVAIELPAPAAERAREVCAL